MAEGELGETSVALRDFDDDPSDPTTQARRIDDDLPDYPEPPGPTPPPPPSILSFAEMMSKYSNFDMNGDGRAEINWLRSLFANPEPYVVRPAGVIVVFVDPRLVTDDSSIETTRLEMLLWLSLLGSDLYKDGYYPYFVEASVYSGPAHQDGRTLLAMRRFLQDVRQNYPLTATLLVGSFPDASIARSTFVKANAPAEYPKDFLSGSVPETGYEGHFMALDVERITQRAEIVLADLDGNWEALYHEQEFPFTSYHVVPRVPSSGYPFAGQILHSYTFHKTTHWLEDVFYIKDHEVRPVENDGSLHLYIGALDEPSPEASPSDRSQPNRIARPEIAVGRLNPRSIAIMPTAPPDLDGKLPLNAGGVPQTLRYSHPTHVRWERSPNLERRLIADYIGRSHRFRLGHDNDKPFRTSAVRGPDANLRSPASLNALLRKSADGFGSSTSADNANLVDYVNWLAQPAVLRAISAHSDPVRSVFRSTLFPLELEQAVGGLTSSGTRVWRWVGKQQGADFIVAPSFEGLTENANFHIYRSLWETKRLASAGQMFVVHEGCEVMRPKHSELFPYDSPLYGQGNEWGAVANGESLMFYANGLGLMARNKVFNDVPAGFYEAVKTSGRFGYGWPAYFHTDAANTGLDERVLDPTTVQLGSDRRWRTLQRKRSYFWNMIGDPTLKIRY
jgi:hypothetical protein